MNSIKIDLKKIILHTSIKSKVNIFQIIGVTPIIILSCFAEIFTFRELLINISFLWILIFLSLLVTLKSFISFLLLQKYCITFNIDDFNYKRLFSKGTVAYTEVEQLYIIKTLARGGKDLYRLKVKLRGRRALVFALYSLRKDEAELMKKIFTIKTKKEYIYKWSAF